MRNQKFQRRVGTGLKVGDDDSFRELFDGYHEQIYRYCMGFIRSPELAEEATADVFIKLWNRRGSINPQLPVVALLYKIARDTALNYLKKIATDQRLRDRYLEEYPFAKNKGVEEKFLTVERATTVRRTIELSPPARRRIFMLHFYQGLGNQHISEILQLSPHTVKSQLVKARHFLRLHLDGVLWWLVLVLTYC